jgi:hypothetical protein
MSGGNTIELAMSALFELCVPTVSAGTIPRTFPSELLVSLTKEEREENEVAPDADAYRVQSDDGFILFEVGEPYCRIITADGDPAEAVAPFLRRLESMNGVVVKDDDTATGHNIAGRIPLGTEAMISVILATRKAEGAAGFYGSASMWKK